MTRAGTVTFEFANGWGAMESSTLVSVMAGLFGAVTGAYLSWLVSRRQRRIDVAFEMHREFNSIDMIQARYRASDLLARYPQLTYQELRTVVGRVELRDVWTVVYFYQRLWLAIKHHGIHKAYVPDLFGDIFTWWYNWSFSTQLIPTPNEYADHISRLKAWMEKHSSPADLKRWEGTSKLFAIGDGPGLAPSGHPPVS